MTYTVYSATNANDRRGQYEHGNFADPDAAEALADDVHEMMKRDDPEYVRTVVEDEHGNLTYIRDAPD
jgi:hypothetical protein